VASISTRIKKDGSKSYMVRWRDPKSHANQGLTVATEAEAETLKRLLDVNGQSFEIAQFPWLNYRADHRSTHHIRDVPALDLHPDPPRLVGLGITLNLPCQVQRVEATRAGLIPNVVAQSASACAPYSD
jgi:hypothetical protein